MEDYMTLNDAAKILGVQRHTLYRWAKEGILKTEKFFGTNHAVHPDELKRFVEDPTPFISKTFFNMQERVHAHYNL